MIHGVYYMLLSQALHRLRHQRSRRALIYSGELASPQRSELLLDLAEGEFNRIELR